MAIEFVPSQGWVDLTTKPIFSQLVTPQVHVLFILASYPCTL